MQSRPRRPSGGRSASRTHVLLGLVAPGGEVLPVAASEASHDVGASPMMDMDIPRWEPSGMDHQQGRWTAELDGDFVIFMIGAVVHDPAVAKEASGLLMAMVGMLDELEADPSKGLLGYTRHGDPGKGVIVQYWRSFDALEAYSRNPGAAHAPVWRAWNRLGSEDRGAAGIWHETFKVNAGNYEAIYQNMPVMGLQTAGRPITVTEAKDSARARLSR